MSTLLQIKTGTPSRTNKYSKRLILIFVLDQRLVCHHLQLSKQKDLQGETRVLSNAQKASCVSKMEMPLLLFVQ